MSAQHNDAPANEIAALLRRADRAVTEGGLRERTEYFWSGYRKALEDLANGTGRRLAAKDRLTHQAMSLLQGAKPALPKGLEVLAAVDVPQGLAAEAIKASRNAVAHLKIDGVQQLEHGEVAISAADLKGEVAHAGVEPDDGSDRHVASISGHPEIRRKACRGGVVSAAPGPMTDEQRQRWHETGLFPVERWAAGTDCTPLVCPLPGKDQLRALAAGVPERIQLSGWYASTPRFGSSYVYADDFRGMGRQHVASLPAGMRYFGTLAEFVAAASPRTVIALLNRIDDLERQLTARQERTT